MLTLSKHGYAEEVGTEIQALGPKHVHKEQLYKATVQFTVASTV